MREWTLGTLAGFCGGKLDPALREVCVTSVTSDSRAVIAGSLFIALRGERTDGHVFAAEAVKQGATAVLCSQKLEEGIPTITVRDTARAYEKMAAGYRKTLAAHVIAITGSAGKTTTKEMTATILQSTYCVGKSAGNHNNRLGLSMSVMDLQPDVQVAVLELGMNHAGEISRLTTIARPDIAVITNIGTAHIEYLGSREGILNAKLEILNGMGRDGTLVLNGDEPLLWNLRETEKLKKVYFGIENQECDVRATDLMQIDDGMCFRVTGLGQHFEVFLPTAGIHNVYNALGAITVGLLLKVRPDRMQHELGVFQNTGMRQKIYKNNGVTIIEDCYNASPESMEASIRVLGGMKGAGRRIAVLGDMLELGSLSLAEHYRIGRLCVDQADLLLVCGNHSPRMVTGAITGGMNPKHARHFDSREALADFVREMVKPGDTLLFKGSRGMKMEQVLARYLDGKD